MSISAICWNVRKFSPGPSRTSTTGTSPPLSISSGLAVAPARRLRGLERASRLPCCPDSCRSCAAQSRLSSANTSPPFSTPLLRSLPPPPLHPPRHHSRRAISTLHSTTCPSPAGSGICAWTVLVNSPVFPVPSRARVKSDQNLSAGRLRVKCARRPFAMSSSSSNTPRWVWPEGRGRSYG